MRARAFGESARTVFAAAAILLRLLPQGAAGRFFRGKT